MRDPAAIYAESFRIVEEESDLSAVSEEARPLAIRLVHACGMPDIVADLVVSDGAIAAGLAALAAGAPILCDAEMVAHGIIARDLKQANRIVCKLADPRVQRNAERDGTTRSAAQVDLWNGQMEGAIVAIGNAPTALFRLLERLDEGAPKPALIIGLPVGFVGAAESKAELARDSRGVPFVTLRGRRGGSAMAAAAVNALARLNG
ncbi:precorrin-8X methylmutase [Aurantimonas sp. Leaf443]|uniref:precorrin-8X methylmutase n=1 Tax=Aurantimonas sp. Leaf443 TaxID=1736378 RepID=UPI0006F42D7E|nr:precorrin-8X methylmutase [Aurantimonas sp. Leaf443]KQT83190.1 precorrin isomerase [Aurantimonas sp. Leaf443]